MKSKKTKGRKLFTRKKLLPRKKKSLTGKKTLKRNYAHIVEEFKEKGKASLRKKMWDKAVKKDNTHMQIWLSKNYLGMRDRTQTETINEPLPLIIDVKAEDV